MNATILFTLQRQTDLYKQYGINYVALFGSYARNEQQQTSDVDVLVDFDEPKSFFELADIQFSLEKALGHRVDLVMKNSIKKNILRYLHKDIIAVYEKK